VSNIALTHPACPPAVLAQYSTNRNSSLRAAVAANPSCPPPILSQLAAEQQPLEVRCPAAANSSCPPDTLTELLNDLWPSVVQAAADNPNLPPHALAMWQLVQDTVQL